MNTGHLLRMVEEDGKGRASLCREHGLVCSAVLVQEVGCERTKEGVSSVLRSARPNRQTRKGSQGSSAEVSWPGSVGLFLPCPLGPVTEAMPGTTADTCHRELHDYKTVTGVGSRRQTTCTGWLSYHTSTEAACRTCWLDHTLPQGQLPSRIHLSLCGQQDRTSR